MIFFSFPVLETEHFQLRELTKEDAPHLYGYFSDEEVVQYYGLEPFIRKEQADQFVTQVKSGFRNGMMIRWAIVDKQTGELLGTVGYHNWNRQHRRAEIGYELKKEVWRRGIMTEVLETVIPFGFDRLLLNRIGATVRAENVSSRELLRKFGFSEEGILQEYQYYLGAFYDLLMYGLTCSMYEEKAGKKQC